MQDEETKKQIENEQHCVVILQNTLNYTELHVDYISIKMKRKLRRKKENEQPGKWEKKQKPSKDSNLSNCRHFVSFKLNIQILM